MLLLEPLHRAFDPARIPALCLRMIVVVVVVVDVVVALVVALFVVVRVCFMCECVSVVCEGVCNV